MYGRGAWNSQQCKSSNTLLQQQQVLQLPWPLIELWVSFPLLPQAHGRCSASSTAAMENGLWQLQLMRPAQLEKPRASANGLVSAQKTPGALLLDAGAPAPSVNCLMRRRTLPRADNSEPAGLTEIAEHGSASLDEVEQRLCHSRSRSPRSLPTLFPP
mmetsp:Transcript_64156/g.126930  ORF Transcript_64156/g.126930 Transcript_64156/m.126930 type:complete len:158 (-) Transcript_64156:1059-1532(-)